MKTSVAILALAVTLAGCAAPSQRIDIPENYDGDLVQLSAVVRPSPIGVLLGEAFCSVISVNGSQMGLEYFLKPGTHSFRLRLMNMGYSYEDDVPLTFAVPGKYELFVMREGSDFTVSARQLPGGAFASVATVKATRFRSTYIPLFIK